MKPTYLPLFALIACSTAPDAKSDPGVAELVASLDDAWNTHSPEAMTEHFAAGGTIVTPQGQRVEGRDALRELFASAGPTKQTTMSSQLEAVQWLGPDLVIIDVTQQLSGPGVEKLGASEGRLAAVAQRIDGQWKVVAARPSVVAGRR